MNSRRFFHLPILIGCLWLGQQRGFGDDAAKVDHFDIPVQNYAPLDISGTTPGDNSVTLVALGDDNKAAFGYPTGNDDYSNPERFISYPWRNGALDPVQTTQCFETITVSGSSVNVSRTPCFLDPTGTVYGRVYNHGAPPANPSPQGDMFYSENGNIHPLSFALGHIDGDIFAISSTGNNIVGEDYWLGNTGVGTPTTTSGGSFIFHAGNYTEFSSSTPDGAVPSNVTMQPDDFAPTAVNTSGYAIGYSGSENLLWDTSDLLSLPGEASVLNDDNDIAGSGNRNQSTSRWEGAYLMEQGDADSVEYFLKNGNDPGLIPTKLQSQIRNIQPFLISNRLANATGTQPVLHILFTADTRRSAANDTWESATFLLRILADGTTDLQEITGLDKYSLKSVNQYGIIAALADPTGDTGPTATYHAMLLIPAELSVDGNGDGQIQLGSVADQTTQDKPYRFWINDDDDKNAPGPVQVADYKTEWVDGAEDLKDFFPAFLDIQQLVKALPPSSSVKYKLKQADGAVNFVETHLTRQDAFSNQSYSTAETVRVTAAGVELSAQFLNGIKNNNTGTILVEGRTHTTQPLVLVVEKDGAKLTEVSLPLSLGARILLLLHGMNSNTFTWDNFVMAEVGYTTTTGATAIRDGEIQGLLPMMTPNGVRCYRLQFGAFDSISTRSGLEDVTAANTPNYLIRRDTDRCGDFETFDQLGQEVDKAIGALLDPIDNPQYKNAQIILVGHSRGGLSARAFLQKSVSNERKSAVIGVLTTGSPHLGSRMARVYQWLVTHPRHQYDSTGHELTVPRYFDDDSGGSVRIDYPVNWQDWSVVDWLLSDTVIWGYHPKPSLDVRRPVIGDLADDNSSTIGVLNNPDEVANLPENIRYGEIVYTQEPIGTLANGYSVFNGILSGIVVYPLTDAARAFVLGAGYTPSNYPGDGLVRAPQQKFTQLSGFGGVRVPPLTNTTEEVLHTQEPQRASDLLKQLNAVAPSWFPPVIP